MLLTEYDEKKTREYLQKEAWETGLEEGRKAGMKQGMKEGENRVNKLVRRLMEDNRLEDLKLSSEDKNFQKKLFQEYGID